MQLFIPRDSTAERATWRCTPILVVRSDTAISGGGAKLVCTAESAHESVERERHSTTPQANHALRCQLTESQYGNPRKWTIAINSKMAVTQCQQQR